MSDQEILDGWKSISAYVGKSIKTIQRWEREAEFPVHRVKGRQSVYALVSEVDTWLLKQENGYDGSAFKKVADHDTDSVGARISFLLKPRHVSPVVWVTLSLLVIWLAMHHLVASVSGVRRLGALEASIVSVSNRKSLFRVENAFGQTVLSISVPFELPLILRRSPGWRLYTVQDLDRDGLDDLILLNWDQSPPALEIWRQTLEGTLKLRKTIVLTDDISYEGLDYPIIRYTSFCLFDLDGDDSPEVAVLGNQGSLYPSVLKVMTLSGDSVVTIEHPGWLQNVQGRRFGEERVLYVAGTNNFITKYSEPVIMRLAMDWRRRNVRFSLLSSGRLLPTHVPSGVSITYARLGSFPTTKGASLWEPAWLRPVNWYTESHLITVEAGFYDAKKRMKPLADGSWLQEIRLFCLDSDLSLLSASYNDLVLGELGIIPEAEPYRSLLKPQYWNGHHWQDMVCSMPQDGSDRSGPSRSGE